MLARKLCSSTSEDQLRTCLWYPSRGRICWLGSLAMKSYDQRSIRNVALVGHNGSGKTTLAEALLFSCGAISRMGSTDEGTTVCDFEPEEAKHKMSVTTSWACFEHMGCKINLLDTPGYADFLHEAKRALEVADLAILVVSAVEGVEVRTEATWNMAKEMGVPRMIFLSKLDRDRASFDRVLGQLTDTFGAGIAPLELPLGEESSLQGVVDLLEDVAVLYEAGSPRNQEVPGEIASRVESVRETLIDGIVVADDSMMERYLEGEIPTKQELEAALAIGLAAGSVAPVVCGSSLARIGIDRLAEFIVELGSPPTRRASTQVNVGDHLQEIPCDPSGEPLASVFKTMVDPYVGRISLLHVRSGTLRPDAVLVNPRTRAEEKLHVLQALRGKESIPVGEAVAGDIVAVPKLGDVVTGDTLAPRSMPVSISYVPCDPPSLAIAIVPATKADEDKLMSSLHRLQEEDPALQVERTDETHQTVLKGMGDVHLQVTIEKLQRKFGVSVTTEPLAIPYRETITKPAEAEGKHKKQTGGHGQFGVATIRIEPLERGAGFEFVDEIVGGAIPKQFIPAVQKGIEEAMASGGVFGYPVVDVRARCLDGKYHPVDSSELSFKLAGALAFKEALAKADPVLLEPIARVEVRVPVEFQGDVMGDLNARRGRVVATDSAGSQQIIVALVPEAELVTYATDLRSLTASKGSFTMTHEHYEPVPAHLAAKLSRA